MKIAALVLVAAVPALADSTLTKKRTVTKLGEGIYEIRHPDAPDTFPQGNTTVVIGDRDVLVVDSTYLPSAAREDIAQIRQWTKKPVRWLVNTHWHYDHTMGNVGYLDAFPGLQIVAQTETKQQIAGYTPGWFQRYDSRVDGFKLALEKGTNADGKPLTDGEKEEYRRAIAGSASVSAEFKPLGARVKEFTPAIAFDRDFVVDLGGREVQVKFLGRGNTAGDAVVYLPAEKLLAAGDLIDHPVPYLGGGYPLDLIHTLEAIKKLEPKTIVPGHGDVLQGTAYVDRILALLRAVTWQVSVEVHRLGNGPRRLDEVKKAVLEKVDVAKLRQEFAGDDSNDRDFFDGFAFNGLIVAAYAQTWPR